MEGETGDCRVNSLFQRSWWLDIVAPGSWDDVEVRSDDGTLLGWWPYVTTVDRPGVRCIDMPTLSLSLGPWISEPRTPDPRRRLAHVHDVLGQLIDLLPTATIFRQNLHHSLATTIPFAHRGFDVQLAYTHVIDDVRDLDAVWKRISTSRRQSINKAKRRVVVTETDDLELFLRLHAMVYQRQHMAQPLDHREMARIDAQLAARDARAILVATDDHGNHHGAHYLVHDELATYGTMSGLDPAHRDSAAGSLLMWEAIRYAAKRSSSFNFCGGTPPHVYPFISSFGAELVPYASVERESLRWRSTKLARDLVRRARRR